VNRTDPVLQELWAIKDAQAKRYGNVQALFRALRAKEKAAAPRRTAGQSSAKNAPRQGVVGRAR
jgi:hypothetical protein